MKKTNYIKLFAGLFAVCSLGACTDNFEEINANPNGPEVVPPALLLPGIQEATADRMYNTFVGGDMGETWVQHWGKVQYNDEERYQYRPGVINTTWNGFYNQPLLETENMYELAMAQDNQVLMGVALIWRSYVYSILTDLYGDIPYTEALRGDEGITNPAYDKQEVIYPALIDSLAKAVVYIKAGEGDLPAARDLVYNGNLEQWVEFANSLQVRMIMRAYPKLAPAYQARLQELVSEGELFESNADDAQLVYFGQNPNANPVWATVINGGRSEWKVNETLVEILDELNDPRIEVYAQLNDEDEYLGVPPGINNPTEAGFGYDNVSAIGLYFLQPDAPAVFMSYAQLNFLLAEAAKLGYIAGGDAVAAEYYYEGIRASFENYDGVTATVGEDEVLYDLPDVEEYLDNTGVVYNSATALEQIGIQQWIALFGQGIEAWTEYRRTGFPALSPAQDPYNITEIPSRYVYPSDEQTLNNANYRAAVEAMGGDALTTPIWWMR